MMYVRRAQPRVSKAIEPISCIKDPFDSFSPLRLAMHKVHQAESVSTTY